jgi:hypothetical protein
MDRHRHGDTEVALSRDRPQGSDETSCVACGKQLFRVGAIPFTAHFDRTIKFQINLSII